jgi:hypothetical protein
VKSRFHAKKHDALAETREGTKTADLEMIVNELMYEITHKYIADAVKYDVAVISARLVRIIIFDCQLAR